MATWYGFSKEGDQMWSITTGEAGAGRIDYIGNGYVLLVNDVGFFLWYVTPNEANQIRTIATFSSGPDGNVDGQGVAAMHTMHSGWGLDDGISHFDSHHCLVAEELTGDALPSYTVNLWDYIAGKKMKKVLTLGGVNQFIGGLTWDGRSAWLHKRNALRFRQYNFKDDGNLQLRAQINTGYSVEDMCYDGLYLYSISTSVVRQFDPAGITATPQQQWNHGLSTPRGLTFTGQDFLIMAA